MENKVKKKVYYGIALTEDHDNCFGILMDQEGRFIGKHISSSYSWLKIDLQSKISTLEKDFDFCFLKYDEFHPKFMIINCLYSQVSNLEFFVHDLIDSLRKIRDYAQDSDERREIARKALDGYPF